MNQNILLHVIRIILAWIKEEFFESKYFIACCTNDLSMNWIRFFWIRIFYCMLCELSWHELNKNFLKRFFWIRIFYCMLCKLSWHELNKNFLKRFFWIRIFYCMLCELSWHELNKNFLIKIFYCTLMRLLKSFGYKIHWYILRS